MFLSLLQKEWIKLRLAVWLAPILAVAAVVQAWFSIKGFRSAHGAVLQYAEFVGKQPIIFGWIEYALIFAGIWLAALQFYPECVGKRLRLLFHLPISYRISLYSMIGIGFMGCLLVGTIAFVAFALLLNSYGFPRELASPMLATLLPWISASLVAYCATAATLAEPRYYRRLAYAFCGVVTVMLMTPNSGYGAGKDWLLYSLAIVFWVVAIEAAALRVKEGD